MNDTSREVGAALGVAVIGSMLSSLYGSRFLDNAARQRARDRLATRPTGRSAPRSASSAQLGRAGAGIADAAREAFVYAMSRASLVTAVIAVVGRVRGVAVPARRARPRRPTPRPST